MNYEELIDKMKSILPIIGIEETLMIFIKVQAEVNELNRQISEDHQSRIKALEERKQGPDNA